MAIPWVNLCNRRKPRKILTKIKKKKNWFTSCKKMRLSKKWDFKIARWDVIINNATPLLRSLFAFKRKKLCKKLYSLFRFWSFKFPKNYFSSISTEQVVKKTFFVSRQKIYRSCKNPFYFFLIHILAYDRNGQECRSLQKFLLWAAFWTIFLTRKFAKMMSSLIQWVVVWDEV